MKTTEAATGGVLLKKSILKSIVNFTGKHLCYGFFLIKWHAFWTATLLKDTPSQVLSCICSEIFKNIYIEVGTLENEIYSCFLISEVIHFLQEKVKKIYRNSFTVKEYGTV